MDATGPEVPPVLPGQGPYMRDVLHLCIVEAAGEIDGVGEISERALNTITDIVLDYLQSVGETARGVAELQCRTRVNLGDLLLGMRGNDVAPAAKPCAAAMEAIRAAQAAEADPERSRIHKIDIAQAIAKSSAKAEANTATNTKRISADGKAGAALAAAMPSLPSQSVQPIIRWASMAAVGASVNPAWGPPPESDVAQHAKRARPADFGEEPGTTAVAVGGGLRRERQPSDPLSGATGTVPGVDDGSSRVASLSDGHLRIMPPNPAESGVPRSNEIRSAGFPGSGPSAPLRRIAEEASKEELLSGTFMPDPSGVAGAE